MELLQEERLMEIVKLIETQGVIRVDALRKRFGVSSRTIRRDLDRLSEEGILRRTYGGAVLARGTGLEPAFELRKAKSSEEKKRICQKAADMIKDGDTIILDSGTTLMYLAKFIKDKKDLVVVTNALNIGLELSDCPGITVVMVGGILRGETLSLIGPETEEGIRRMTVDRAFVGTSGLSAERGYTNSNLFEAGVKKAMLDVARESVVLADHTKFGVLDFSSFARAEDADMLITDAFAPENEVEEFRRRGVKVLTV